MNIHIIYNCYWGDGISGGDRRLLEILKRWHDTNDYKFIVYTTHRFYGLMKSEGITHFEVEFDDDKEKSSSNIVVEYLKRTLACIKNVKRNVENGDIIYSPTDILPDVIPAIFVKKRMSYNITWYLITHHIYERFYKRPGNKITNFISCYQQKCAMYFGKKHSNMYLTPSPIVIKYMEEHHYNMQRVDLVGNAVDIAAIEYADINIKGYDACFLARLNYSKGIFELPEIWKKVTTRFPNARLAIMGKGNEEINLQMKQCIEKYNMQNNIDMLGYVEADKAYSIMKHSKLFLFTSHEEGWGIALAEALVCGIPVVAYELPVFLHLFKEGVKLCKLKDTEEMAEGVCWLLDNEDKRAEMGTNGRKYIIDHYSWDKVAGEELELILMNNTRES